MRKSKFIFSLMASVVSLLFATMATSAFSHFSFESKSATPSTSYSQSVVDNAAESVEPEKKMHNLNDADGYNLSEERERKTHAKTKKSNQTENKFKNHNL